MSETRYFGNPYARPGASLPHFKLDARSELETCLERLIRRYPPSKVSPSGGLYYGAASVACLLYSLSTHYPGLTISGKDLTHWLKAYLNVPQRYARQFHKPGPSHCGVGDDTLSLLALEAMISRNENAVKDLCSWAQAISEDGGPSGKQASNEWLYGRAGYLYLLRLAWSPFKDNTTITELISETISSVIETIIASPRPWIWHGKAYIGTVHGTIGIITQVVLSDPSYADRVLRDLEEVLSLQNKENGNWPSSLESGNSDRLVQFCHGATGVVHSLIRLRPYFPRIQEQIDAAIESGRNCVWEKGILTKESCMCHGTTGSALVLDEARRGALLGYTTEDHIKSWVNQRVVEPSDDGEGLWTGIAGRAWAWAIADKNLPVTFLGYDDV